MSIWKATKVAEMSAREKAHMEKVRKFAAEGMVLLENDGTLPLAADTKKIALFGNGARHMIKGGKGSGDVNSRSVVGVEQGILEAGCEVVSGSWLDEYDKICTDAKAAYDARVKDLIENSGNPMAGFMEIFNNPYHDPDVQEIADADMADADAAVYVIARDSGEGRDRKPVAGDYELTDNEKKNIEKLAAHYDKFVVALNVGGVVDTKALRSTKGVGAVLLMSQAGNVIGTVFADALLGKSIPTGHLAMTWAENYSDYPAYDTFSSQNGNVDDEYYNEGIFVGYRYFDSFGKKPAYPFGYGLSYTSFDINVKDVSLAGEELTAKVEVKNTGDKFAGKQLVQLYVSAPDGNVEKPVKELKGFAKTKELKPGESDELTIKVKVSDFASYDEAKASYVLEPGKYFIRIGENACSTHIAAAVEVAGEIVTQKLANKMKVDTELKEISAKGATPLTYDGEESEKAAAKVLTLDAAAIKTVVAEYEGAPTEYNCDKAEKITLEDVKSGKATMEDLLGQLTREEMADLCVGTARGGFGGTSVIGTASAVVPGAAGDTSSKMAADRGVHNLVLADGPAGLRLTPYFAVDEENQYIPEMSAVAFDFAGTFEQPTTDIKGEVTKYYQYCTAIPIATMLAQTWNMDVIEEAGDIVGIEMEELGVNLWLAPGMNIQKNPLCGRNFEYYSEDPLLAGMCAAADTKGVQKHKGCGTTIKHFACNNQEDNRMHTNAHVSERALREIYLKGFEVAVKESQPLSIMTSYNLINGIHAANNYDLLTAICRNEWGFEGVVMTDWGTTGGIEMEQKTFKYGCSNAADCVRSGNDLTMPGSDADVQNILDNGVTRAELQACTRRILDCVLKCRY
ncbi:beta-glucosidase [Butyrivibrio sp. WCD3002]|uniref:beta-glucosidase n=1 Tax=Butyrivibrio sp. WCD3002 TaxID=1280676 RepID=UPI0004005C51|nr:glycoside hydrolase family 3 N-terminal domain-containing protein [Butyrivibrio sp. WCD3002]